MKPPSGNGGQPPRQRPMTGRQQLEAADAMRRRAGGAGPVRGMTPGGMMGGVQRPGPAAGGPVTGPAVQKPSGLTPELKQQIMSQMTGRQAPPQMARQPAPAARPPSPGFGQTPTGGGMPARPQPPMRPQGRPRPTGK